MTRFKTFIMSVKSVNDRIITFCITYQTFILRILIYILDLLKKFALKHKNLQFPHNISKIKYDEFAPDAVFLSSREIIYLKNHKIFAL